MNQYVGTSVDVKVIMAFNLVVFHNDMNLYWEIH